jgi:hypothetical protein
MAETAEDDPPRRGRGRPRGTGRPLQKVQRVPGVAAGAMMPLDYMLAVIRDSTARTDRRDKMAIAAAPYCHPRVADARKGKKDRQVAAAVTAGKGTAWASDLEFEGRAN